MKEIRILITGVGRRVELMQAFRQAALKLNIDLKLYGADMAGTAPALAYCDFTRIVCAMREPQYIQQLVDICRIDKIQLVMPTIDTDLLVLSQNADRFEEAGTRVLVSKPDKIRICRDKNYTGAFFASCGLLSPKTYKDYTEYPGPYPCFIKPKDGSGSVNAFKVTDKDELAVYARRVKDYIVQPFISGKEFTVDIFCDFDGNPIYITPRERVQVRAGEVLKTRISMDETIIEQCLRLCEAFKPCGPMTVQLIRDEATGENYYIEINPRYGGGAPLSMKAGAGSAEALLRILCGETVDFRTDAGCDGAVYSRFDQCVCVFEGEDTQPVEGVIFDLDDTLYSEKQYVKSGFGKIAEYLGKNAAAEKLWAYFEAGKPAIDAYLAEIGQADKKDECLKIYREQLPDIELYADMADLLKKLRDEGVKIGIITDGRPEGQKNKIKALGLDALADDIIITDELGGVQFRKPCDIAFRIMQNRWEIPYERIIYVGDNPRKDFQACRQLGMRWVYFRNENGLHSHESTTEGIKSTAEVSAYVQRKTGAQQ